MAFCWGMVVYFGGIVFSTCTTGALFLNAGWTVLAVGT